MILLLILKLILVCLAGCRSAECFLTSAPGCGGEVRKWLRSG